MIDSINRFLWKRTWLCVRVYVCVRVRWTLSLPYDDWWAPEDQPVIVLADLADGHQGFQVLVRLVGVDVVEGAAVPGIPVGSREVYGHLRHTHAHAHAHTDERVCHRRGKYNNKHTQKKARGDSLWTESGSLPWCNQERNTFWWPDGGRNCRKTLDWNWERRNELCVAGSWRVALVCLGIYGRLKKLKFFHFSAFALWSCAQKWTFLMPHACGTIEDCSVIYNLASANLLLANTFLFLFFFFSAQQWRVERCFTLQWLRMTTPEFL